MNRAAKLAELTGFSTCSQSIWSMREFPPDVTASILNISENSVKCSMQRYDRYIGIITLFPFMDAEDALNAICHLTMTENGFRKTVWKYSFIDGFSVEIISALMSMPVIVIQNQINIYNRCVQLIEEINNE